VGSDQPYVKTTELRKKKFIIPPFKEQQKIVSILSEIEKKIECEIKKKTMFEALKKELMQKLLTGKIRVKV
jgi:type I restriction enzyme, S subunit